MIWWTITEHVRGWLMRPTDRNINLNVNFDETRMARSQNNIHTNIVNNRILNKMYVQDVKRIRECLASWLPWLTSSYECGRDIVKTSTFTPYKTGHRVANNIKLEALLCDHCSLALIFANNLCIQRGPGNWNEWWMACLVIKNLQANSTHFASFRVARHSK